MLHHLFRSLRMLIYWLDLVLFTLVMYVLALFPRDWIRGFYPRLFWAWSRAFVRALGIDLCLHQKNARPLPEHYILVANHPSAFEDVGIPALFDVYSLAKAEVRDWWIVGRISVAAGTLYVTREDRASRKAAYAGIIDAVRSGRNVSVYPEGGCKGRRIFESFRYGPFDISMQTGVPILPVFLHYEAQEDFEWQDQTLLEKIRDFLSTRNSRANYYVFDAIDPAGFDSKEAFTEHVHGLYLRWQAKYLE